MNNMDDLLNIDIRDLTCFSTKIKNALLFSGIEKVSDLVSCSARDLLRIPGIGKKGCNQIIAFCQIDQTLVK